MDAVTGFFIALIACLPSAVTGFCFWIIQQKLQKEATKREKEEKKRADAEKERERLLEEQEFLVVQGVIAAITLGEATAKAVQRIPDAHCNGDMHAALDYAGKVKHNLRDFIEKQGVVHLHE